MPPRIYLYAEILTHIRQLTLHASLQTEKEEGTKLDVSTDKKVISVTHDGETQKLYLPTQISGDAQITFPLQRKTEISSRIQIEDEHEWKCMINNEIEAPWMAAELTTNAAIQCRHCESVVVAAGTIKQWKDLPSENWADLMDFWFCHKPHDEGQNDAQEAATAKGFSSKSGLAIAAGIGMTDLISLVLHGDDCTNVKAAETQKKPDATVLRCSKCLEMLGTTNQEEDLVRLHKASISIDTTGTLGTYESYPSTIFTCAQILSLIEATALKRFVVHSVQASTNSEDQEQNAAPLILWIFNPDIYYSCSAYDGNGVLSNAIITESAKDPNPNGDDTSNIYNEGHHTSNEAEFAPAAAVDQDAAERNPNSDNTSAIYGETVGPQFVSGDLEFEVPVHTKEKGSSNKEDASEDTPASTFGDIPIDSIEETETPLITSKQTPASGSSTTHASQDSETSQGDMFLAEAMSQTPQATSTTQHDTSQPNDHINLVHRAAKIFYKPLPPDQTAISFLDENTNTHEDLYLPNPADLVFLRSTLEKSTAMLPSSARSFQDWSVGLLNRYEKVPSGLGVMQENPLARGVSAKDGRVTRWDLGHGAEGLFA
ncbi:hypothetical protein PMZ80_007219 [Knufia obscura]|uniref:Ubiquitin-conjugating enzyme E2C-binding protein n=1 Tax=Knufia obscura TaxID=1635080 RepID=A0ABR0RJK6_9EURO|nr:hypothetical protein PMZ80_007219 [Knufia obscura]